ncbi:hypothetical protein FXO38_05092 [Capsicum annuum]|nr:hypothetical protein FXO38_05092 [Capsicum annuum]
MDDKGLGNTISIPSCARGLRIFVVDPDTSSLLHTATILEDQSYKVTTIEFPNIALSLIQEKEDQYDLVIVEVDMPEMDGFTFLKHIIRETDIPIILMSQKANLEMGKRALEGGACFFETKPLRVKDLINVWQHIFHNKVKAMLEKVNKRRLTYQEEESFTEQNKRKCRQVNMKEKKKEEAEVHINNLEQKQRLIWTPQLHLKFLKAVDALGGEKSTMAANNLDATFDRINDNIKDTKWHVERLRQLVSTLIPTNPKPKNQTPCDESFPKEEVSFPNPHQGKSTTSYNTININCCGVASNSQKGVVTDLPKVEMFKSFFCNTLGDIRSREDQTLVVSTKALVDPLDDEIDSSRKNNLCPSNARPYNSSKAPLPIDEGIHTLVDPCANQGKCTLVCEFSKTSEDVNEDQLTYEYIPLLEHICGMSEKSQVSDGAYRVDLYGAHDSLNILCGKTLASSFVHRDHVYGNIEIPSL